MLTKIKLVMKVLLIAIGIVAVVIAGYFLAVLSSVGIAVAIIYILVREYHRKD